MILDKTVVVTASGRNKPYYEEKGYVIPTNIDNRGRTGVKKGTKIEISVFDLPPTSNVKIRYECDDCGDIKTVGAHTIFARENSQYSKTGETVCGNCANKRMKGVNNSKYKHGESRYCEYRCNAKKRGIDFYLSVEEFKKLISQECHYCGGYSTNYSEKSRGNGIDRKYSDKPYELENCLPCCSRCNFIKSTVGYKEFVNHIITMAERLKVMGGSVIR